MTASFIITINGKDDSDALLYIAVSSMRQTV